MVVSQFIVIAIVSVLYKTKTVTIDKTSISIMMTVIDSFITFSLLSTSRLLGRFDSSLVEGILKDFYQLGGVFCLDHIFL